MGSLTFCQYFVEGLRSSQVPLRFQKKYD